MSAPSLAPSNGSIVFKALTKDNFIIEGKDSGFVVTNTLAGALSNVTTEILPTYFEKDSYSVYTVSFEPLNFERNMQIKLFIPDDLYVVMPAPNCTGVKGTSQSKISCNYDRGTTRVLTFTDAVVSTDLMPALI